MTTVCSLLFFCLLACFVFNYPSRLHLFYPYRGNKILFPVFSLSMCIAYLLEHAQLLPVMVHTRQSCESQLICILDVYTHMLGPLLAVFGSLSTDTWCVTSSLPKDRDLILKWWLNPSSVTTALLLNCPNQGASRLRGPIRASQGW